MYSLIILLVIHVFASDVFITSPHMNPKHVIRISKFRSTVGHPDTCPLCNDTLPLCQSEKHYFDYFLNITLPNIHSPVDGEIVQFFFEEGMGTQVHIMPKGCEDYNVQLFHISGFSKEVGDTVKSGEVLGKHFTKNTYSDIAVIRDPTGACVLSSAFSHMTSEVLGLFGVKNYEDIIITQEERNKYPSLCFKNPDPCRDQMKETRYPPNWASLNITRM